MYVRLRQVEGDFYFEISFSGAASECMWKSVSAVRVCASKARQCEIKEWNINRYPLGGGLQRHRPAAGWGSTFYVSAFQDFPRALVPAAPRRRWRSACDVSAARALGSGCGGGEAPCLTTARRLSSKLALLKGVGGRRRWTDDEHNDNERSLERSKVWSDRGRRD